MLTIHHSEQLAVWAYRNHVVDFLVKPITDDDISRCHTLLTTIQSIEAQDKRSILNIRSRIPSEIPSGQRLRHQRLLPALRYVEKNFRGKIRNADVAELCDMSRYYFSHEFAEAFSLTFQEYVLCYRILEACSELRHPNVPVTNVAYSVGFNDPSYFARVFRRYLGCSPTEYCVNADKPEFTDRRDGIARRLELTRQTFTAVDRQKADRRISNGSFLQT
jgi:AraC-like DNA-binding protein